MTEQKKAPKEAVLTKLTKELAERLWIDSNRSIMTTINEVVKAERANRELNKQEKLAQKDIDNIWDANRKAFAKRCIESAEIFYSQWEKSRSDIRARFKKLVEGGD